ncbi:MAG: hypothetical protein ACUZ8N_06655 [Candidatus Scalindua sp.]
MKFRPIPMNCDNFNIHKCPHRNEKLMKEYIGKTKLIEGITVDLTEGFSLAPKVYETFCENCKNKSFRDN